MLKVRRILLTQDTNEPVSVIPQIVDPSTNENEEDGNDIEARENDDEEYEASAAFYGVWIGSAEITRFTSFTADYTIDFNNASWETEDPPEKTYLPKLTGKRMILVDG